MNHDRSRKPNNRNHAFCVGCEVEGMMSAVLEKRLFTTSEAQTYLGLKRRTFEMYIGPLLRGKGVKIGPSIVYERTDLDAAWNKYKMSAGEQRSADVKGGNVWSAKQQAKQASFAQQTEATKSIENTGNAAFANVASLILNRQKNG